MSEFLSQTFTFLSFFDNNYLIFFNFTSIQLTRNSFFPLILKSDILFKPWRWIVTWAPYGIMISFFNHGLVPNYHKLIAVFFNSLFTRIIMCLNLPVLIRIKINKLIYCSIIFSVVFISFKNLIWPLSCFDFCLILWISYQILYLFLILFSFITYLFDINFVGT